MEHGQHSQELFSVYFLVNKFHRKKNDDSTDGSTFAAESREDGIFPQ